MDSIKDTEDPGGRSPPQKYTPVLFNNALISEGPPSVWKLAARKKRGDKVTRVTAAGVSNKTPKTARNVLLLGETGSGKSTLINALFNFTVGVEWNDKVWFDIIDEGSDDQTQSVTAAVTVYELPVDKEGFSLTVVDTPGLGDTRGSDGLLMDRLLDLLQSQDGVSEIHAVGLVLKATENRLSDRMAYVFNSLTSLFHRDGEQNIVVLFTHSDGRKPTNALQALKAANVKCSRDKNGEPVHFLFDNCQRDDRTVGTKYLALAYETSTRNTESFIKFLQQESKALSGTVKVLQERISLRQNIQKLKDQVQQVKEKEKEIHQATEALDKYTMKMESTENFTSEKIETYKAQEPVDMIGLIFRSGAMCCTECKFNCHYPGCTWARTPALCDVIQNGKCTICPGKCPTEKHVKDNKRYVEKFRKVTQTNEKMKINHERNKSKKDETETRLGKLEKEKSDFKQAKDNSLDEVFQIIEQLEKIALNVDSVFTYVHLDFLIENMKERGDTSTLKVQKLETMRARADEPSKTAAKYLETVQ